MKKKTCDQTCRPEVRWARSIAKQICKGSASAAVGESDEQDVFISPSCRSDGDAPPQERTRTMRLYTFPLAQKRLELASELESAVARLNKV